MYLYIGQNELIPEERIVGVFDMDKCSAGPRAREFLNRAETAGETLDVSGDLPLSFVVCTHPYHEQIVYLSQLSPATLKRRWEQGELQDGEDIRTGDGENREAERTARRRELRGGENCRQCQK